MPKASNQGGAFDELVSAIEEVRRSLRSGMPLVRRTVEIPDPPPAYTSRRIRQLRQRFGMSRAIFARVLAVSPVTLQKWEQGTKSPSPQSRRLLETVEEHRDMFAERLTIRPLAMSAR
jgi:putative transcriptional regulator